MQDLDIMGAIKIKDGIFIGDEFASKVCSPNFFPLSNFLGSRVHSDQQSHKSDQLRRKGAGKSLGEHWSSISDIPMA